MSAMGGFGVRAFLSWSSSFVGLLFVHQLLVGFHLFMCLRINMPMLACFEFVFLSLFS